MTNKVNTVFYIGVTNDIARRVWQHQQQENVKSFTCKYNINKLVHSEPSPTLARRLREKNN